MLPRRLSIEQARSQYLRTLTESKSQKSGKEQESANRALKQAVRALQQAQMNSRLQKSRRAAVNRPSDWNIEES